MTYKGELVRLDQVSPGESRFASSVHRGRSNIFPFVDQALKGFLDQPFQPVLNEGLEHHMRGNQRVPASPARELTKNQVKETTMRWNARIAGCISLFPPRRIMPLNVPPWPRAPNLPPSLARARRTTTDNPHLVNRCSSHNKFRKCIIHADAIIIRSRRFLDSGHFPYRLFEAPSRFFSVERGNERSAFCSPPGGGYGARK